MELDPIFFINSILIGFALAMDAFSVSLANGLNERCMKTSKEVFIAGTFAVFQAVMPIIGWVCVHTVIQHFVVFEKLIPWIALILLSFIGGKMLIEGIKNPSEECDGRAIKLGGIIVQGIATSIDALSVGFTIADYKLPNALLCALIIAVITFLLCIGGIKIGKKFGTKLSNKASIIGGAILIIIGIEIFIKGILS